MCHYFFQSHFFVITLVAVLITVIVDAEEGVVKVGFAFAYVSDFSYESGACVVFVRVDELFIDFFVQ